MEYIYIVVIRFLGGIWMKRLLFLGIFFLIWSFTAFGKEKRVVFDFAFSYYDGIAIGLLCMVVLPVAFKESSFWLGVLGIICGVSGSCVLEHQKKFWVEQQWLHSAAVSILVWFWLFEKEVVWVRLLMSPFLVAFFGGVALFLACDGVLPEGKGRKEGFFRGLGGMCGFLTTMIFF